VLTHIRRRCPRHQDDWHHCRLHHRLHPKDKPAQFVNIQQQAKSTFAERWTLLKV
jgi:hypothetical protein